MKGVLQRNIKDCGIACLLTIIKYYKGSNTYSNLYYLTKCDNNGISALNLINASNKLGFYSRGIKCDIDNLSNIYLPAICHVIINNYNHYVVLYKVTKDDIYIFDPATGNKKLDISSFRSIWSGIVIELKPFRKLDNIKENYNEFKLIIRSNWYHYFKIFLLSILGIIFSLVSNFYFKFLIEYDDIKSILIFFSIIIFIKEIIEYLKNRSIIKLDKIISNSLYIKIHEKLLSLPINYFNSRCKGDIITKVNDIEYIKELYLKMPIYVLIDTSMIIFISIILVGVSKILFLYFILIALIYVILILLTNKCEAKLIRENQDSNSDKNIVLLENIRNIETIKNINIEGYRHNKFKNKYQTYEKSVIEYSYYKNKIEIFKNIIVSLGINIILYLGIILVKQGSMKLSNLILFYSIMIYFIEPLNDIVLIRTIFKNGINAIKRVNEIFSITSNDTNKEISNYDIKINNLSFSYDGYKDILKNIDYKIPYKSKLLVLGNSGIGKSTLFKIINKSYEVDSNKVFIGNVDINIINSKIISYVSQDEMLFNDTLLNNMVLDKDKSIDEIIKITNVDKIMNNKNISFNNVIEEGGTNLSRGERQKIILARTLLRNNKIIILDEALNGLDFSEEKEILERIICKFKDSTIIYISHNRDLINLFDNIIEFKEGGIYEVIG